jgi:replicative DNA helicase
VNQQYQIDRKPPQATDFEQLVVGAAIIESTALDQIPFLTPGMFYDEKYRTVFEAVMQLKRDGRAVDIATVARKLYEMKQLETVGGALWVSDLTRRVANGAHIEHHARYIQQCYLLREVINVSTEVQRLAYEPEADAFEVLNKASSKFFAIEDGVRKGSQVRTAREVAKLERESYLARENARLNGKTYGVPTGFSGLDAYTFGWQVSDLVILAARPGMGKTALALAFAHHAAANDVPTAIFSLEMNCVQLFSRLVLAESQVSSGRYKSGALETWEANATEDARKKLEALGLYIDDTPGLSVFEMRAKCRRLKAQHNLGMVVVDYLQLMTAGESGRGNREQEISTISRTLKVIAKELNVPVIALSQLSRAVETRGGDKRPQLSDLRESGAIEQDADLVLFIHRAEYYGFTTDSEGNSTAGVAEVLIAKHRNGALGTVQLRFIDYLMKFQDTHHMREESTTSAIQPNTSWYETEKESEPFS